MEMTKAECDAAKGTIRAGQELTLRVILIGPRSIRPGGRRCRAGPIAAQP